MISLKPLRESAVNFPEPLKSIVEMSKDSMPEKDFVEFFISIRRKAREMDAKQEVNVR